MIVLLSSFGMVTKLQPKQGKQSARMMNPRTAVEMGDDGAFCVSLFSWFFDLPDMTHSTRLTDRRQA
jgi:hypothetical protein